MSLLLDLIFKKIFPLSIYSSESKNVAFLTGGSCNIQNTLTLTMHLLSCITRPSVFPWLLSSRHQSSHTCLREFKLEGRDENVWFFDSLLGILRRVLFGEFVLFFFLVILSLVKFVVMLLC